MKLTHLFILIILNFSFKIYANDSLGFVNELLREGDFSRALTVAKEKEFSQRGNYLGFSFQKKILETHIRSGDFENFDSQIEKMFKNYQLMLKSYNLLELESETAYLIGNYSYAFNLIRSEKVDEDKKLLFAVKADEKYPFECKTENCERIKKVEKKLIERSGQKNESTAAFLGIIPGLGQYYAGQKSSGVATFILNGIIFGTSIAAFNNDEQILGYASAIVGTTFYASSIYAGYEASRRFNASVVNTQKKKLNDIPIKIQLIDLVFE